MITRAIIEIPMGTNYKYEAEKHSKDTYTLKLDRVLNQNIPFNYGFLERTLAEDNDPTDIFIISHNPIPPLTAVEIGLIGIFKCKDNGVQDDKVIAIIKGDTNFEGVGNFTWGNRYLDKIRDYLSSYKEGFVIEKFESAEIADVIIQLDNYKYLNQFKY